MSHSLKESLVRGIPINQQKFNLNISVAQLVACLILSPILLAISFKYDTYPDGSQLHKLQIEEASFGAFYGKYMQVGFECAFNFVPNGDF